MAHDLTDEHRLFADTARRIGKDRLEPLAARLDRGEGRAEMLENLKQLAGNGFMAINISGEFGGTDADSVSFALTIAALAESCASTAVTVSVTNMVAEIIATCGTDDQKTEWLPKIADGSISAGAFCLTETGAGSDPSSMKTRARMDGNEWVIDGAKLYITSAEYAGLFVVWAVTDPDAPRGKGISAFLVPAGTAGMTIGKAETKLGQTGSATNEVTFDNCRIPTSAVLGEVNRGFRIAVGELAGGRIGVAALAYGIARSAMDAGIAYIKEREQFGRPLSDMQGLQWMVADRETDLEAARLLIINAARIKDAGEPFGKAASMAKLFASEAAQRATYTALQLHGGAGYIADYPVERHARDARITTIYEGTSEIQRLIIARAVLSKNG